jgi:hypothetical protein
MKSDRAGDEGECKITNHNGAKTLHPAQSISEQFPRWFLADITKSSDTNVPGVNLAGDESSALSGDTTCYTEGSTPHAPR